MLHQLRWRGLLEADELLEDPEGLRALVDSVRAVLENPERDWAEARVGQLGQLAEVLEANSGLPKSLAGAAQQLRTTAAVLSEPHPRESAVEGMESRRPKFRLFSEDLRELPSGQDLNVAQPDFPAGLVNLLKLAGTSQGALQQVIAQGESVYETEIKECNKRLASTFSTAWSQSEMTVELKVEGTVLKVRVTVTDVKTGKEYVSTFGERSDGLRQFVAMVAFIHSTGDTIPPILLVDEAELHLHINAQADLIAVLQDEIPVTQVLYTTHSPGCLPFDLGRGVRFVEPQENYYRSDLRHNFWDSKTPGFSAVLFKMGAGAFAFTALRNAVLAEGPSDMVLLPSLLKLATGLQTLKYQVAPRLADFDEDELFHAEVAANVAYLVDGDQGGTNLKRHLVKKRRIHRSLVVSHSTGYAVEDYVDIDQYLEAVNSAIRPDGPAVAVAKAALPVAPTIGKQVDLWARANGVEISKFAIASQLVMLGPNLKLRSGARSRLENLHLAITAALATKLDS